MRWDKQHRANQKASMGRPEVRARKREIAHQKKIRDGTACSMASRGKISATLMGHVVLATTREKLRLAGLGKTAWNKGKPQSATHRKNNQLAHKGIKGHSQSVASRQQISKTRAERIHKGIIMLPFNGRGKCGWFYSKKNKRTIRYRSLLEKRWYICLEKLENVLWFKTEPIVIPYIWDGMIHHYLPDLVVKYTSGERKMIEIKPEGQWTNPQNLAKWDAATKWCEEAIRISFLVVGYEKLAEYEESL